VHLDVNDAVHSVSQRAPCGQLDSSRKLDALTLLREGNRAFERKLASATPRPRCRHAVAASRVVRLDVKQMGK
jgi:hypothetical protein